MLVPVTEKCIQVKPTKTGSIPRNSQLEVLEEPPQLATVATATLLNKGSQATADHNSAKEHTCGVYTPAMLIKQYTW